MKLKSLIKNKKTIIVTTISLILVLVISASYAYFVLKAKEKEETKKIQVQTKKTNLKIEGTTIMTLNNVLSKDSCTISFTVQNTGALETTYGLDIVDVINTFGNKEKLVYKIEQDNNEVKEYTQAPSNNSILLENISIKPKVIHKYTLRLYFKESGKNQNNIQGKVFSGRVQINNTSGNLKTILAHNILKTETPDFSKGEPPYSMPGRIAVNTGSGIYRTQDDQGISYYFRGSKEELNNNVKFANKDWKIIRINGDGTIRLILDKKAATDSKFNDYIKQEDIHVGKYTGYTYDNANNCTKEKPCEVTYNGSSFSNELFGGKNSDIKTALEKWYTSKLKDYNDKIAQGYFCNDSSYGTGTEDSTNNYLYYGAYDRIVTKKQPSLECPDPTKQDGTLRNYGGIYKTKIGLITADELNMAGCSWGEPHADKTNYLYKNYWWWTLSPSGSFSLYELFEGFNGYIAYDLNTDYAFTVVPVINLSTSVLITSGDGSKQSPFVVN